MPYKPSDVASRASAAEFVPDAIVWTDGGARGNPGPAGCGAVLKSPNGEVLAAVSEALSVTTNNVAEYRGLLLGLTQAIALGIRRLEVRADSELLIKQLRGEYRVKSPLLKPLYERAKALLREFEATKLVHVRRELNVEADELANQAMDELQRASAESASKSGDK